MELNHPNQNPVDLSIFERGGQAPGIYFVNIYLNKNLIANQNVRFKSAPNNTKNSNLQPCFTLKDLVKFGIKAETLKTLATDQTCLDLNLIPQAHYHFNFSKQTLQLDIPQAFLENETEGYISPRLWQEGINAYFVDYQFSGDQTKSFDQFGRTHQSQYLSLQQGLNLGPWRLRNYSTWSKSADKPSQWHSLYSYLQRDIISLKSQLVIGDSNAPNDIFDSFSFRGIQLMSDTNMLPDSLQGYAPIIKGIARTNAQLIIRQNNYVIYQRYIPAGPFEVNDMLPTGGSGDLYVTIKESDGNDQNFVVPFASLPILQRPGSLKYSVTSGFYRAYNVNNAHQLVSQATFIYGLSSNITAYGGLQSAGQKYQALALGIGTNINKLGAISFDVTQAQSRLAQQNTQEQGQSWRFRYSKNLNETGTNIALAGYRYSTKGFRSLEDTLTSDDIHHQNFLTLRRKNRLELSLNQNLSKNWGSLTLTLIDENYWNTSENMQSIQFSYNFNWGALSIGLNYALSRNVQSFNPDNSTQTPQLNNRIIALNFNFPLSALFGNTYVGYNISNTNQGDTTQNASIGGTLLANNNLTWSVQQSLAHSQYREDNHTGVNVSYKGTYGEINSGYNYSKQNQQLHYGLQGGLLIHRHGITFGQSMNETSALISAPGAAYVDVNNQPGVKTDGRGYALLPFVTPYRKNIISLNSASFPKNLDVDLTSQSVIPTRGAIVEARFETKIGYRALFTFVRPNQQSIPFGAIVLDANDSTKQLSIVGDNDQAYLTGLSDTSQFKIRWGNAPNEQCLANFHLSPALKNQDIIVTDLQCQ